MNVTGTSNPYRQYLSTYNSTHKSEAVETKESEEGTTIEKIKDFTYGVLGIDVSEESVKVINEVEDQGDAYYKVGQYVKAAGTVGSVICFFV